MTTTERTRSATVLALLVTLLAAAWGLSQGFTPVAAAEGAGTAYAGALTLLSLWFQVTAPAVILHCAKAAGLTVAASMLVACSSAYAGWRLLHSRSRAVRT